MFNIFKTNPYRINSGLNSYIRNSLHQSIKKYTKEETTDINKNNMIFNKLNDKDIGNIITTRNELIGFLFFLSIPIFIHYLYTKK